MRKAGGMFQRGRVCRYFIALCCLFAGAWIAPRACSADDLFVGNFFGPDSGVYEYDGTTGAFIGKFGPADSFPLGGAFGAGGFYVSNSDTDVVLLFNGTTSTLASVENAAGLTFGATGNLFVVTSSSPGLLTMLSATGTLLNTSDAGGILMDPEGITLGPDGNIYVAGGDGNNVLKFNGTTGAFIGTFVTAGSGGLQSARGVAFGPNGNLFVTSFANTEVLEYDGTTGAFIGSFASVTGACSGLSMPRDLTFGPNGNLFVTSFGSGGVYEFNGSTGACVGDFIPATGTGGLGGPTFLLFGPAGGGSSAVPEPSGLSMLGFGVLGLLGLGRRRMLA